MRFPKSAIPKNYPKTIPKNILKNVVEIFPWKILTPKTLLIENQIQNSDNVSKSIWKIINDETKRTPEVTEGLSLATDGVKYSERLAVCKVFNDYFINNIVDELVTS